MGFRAVLLLTLPATLLSGQEPAALKTKTDAAILGQILNAQTGEPLRKATLTLWREDTLQRNEFTRESDATGKFEFHNLQPGRYKLIARRTGFVAQAYGARRPGWSGSTPITLTAAQELKGLTISLTPHGVITGRVVDEDGDPLEHIVVAALWMRWVVDQRRAVPVVTANTNDLGEYRLSGLSPGNYLIQAAPRAPRERTREPGSADEPKAAIVATYYPSVTDPAAAMSVPVRAGGETRGIDVRMVTIRVLNVRGTVVSGLTGKPARAGLMLRPKGSPMRRWLEMREAETKGSDSQFEFRGVPSGVYDLIAGSSTQGQQSGASETIQVGEENLKGLLITLQPAVEIQGKVKELRRLVIGYARWDESSPDAAAEVSEDGDFTIKGLLPGRYRVSCSGCEGVFVKAARRGDQNVLEEGLEVSPSAGGVLEIVLSTDAPELTGIVQNEDGKPLTGGIVVLLPEEKSRRQYASYFTANTDQLGGFHLKGIRPGKYSVLAFEELEGSEYMDPDFIKPIEKHAVSITLEEGARQTLQLKAVPSETSAPQKERPSQ